MATSGFDPNGVGISNGNIFGFPYTLDKADIVIIPVPWDATASYGKGTSKAPQAILEASTQLDFYHPNLNNAYETKIHLLPTNPKWVEKNMHLCNKASEYIAYLENGGQLTDAPHFQLLLNEINTQQVKLKNEISLLASQLREQGKFVAILGGEHSVPLGLIESLAKKHRFGVLQIDAHADLRNSYEGFEQSHASIMHNVLKIDEVEALVQVGIRDLSQEEANRIEQDSRIHTFFDWNLKNEQYQGKTWFQQCKEIISTLPSNVYISFDIDGLKPYLCPKTGTPVVGGFELSEINFLLFELVKSGRKIIGFDLNEVGVSENSDWDANVGARALWNLCIASQISMKRTS
jgi:agmatinase